MSIFRQKYTKPIPDGAAIITRKDVQYAKWTDRYGHKHTNQIISGRRGAQRIIRESQTYWIRYADASGVKHQENSGCRSRDAATAVLADKRRRVELVRAKIITQAEDTAADHASTPIALHVEKYLSHLSLQASATHVTNVRANIYRLLSDCNIGRLMDIESEGVTDWIKTQATKGMGPRTINTYRSALYSFCRWCVNNKRITHNPLVTVFKAKEKKDIRHQRRALTEADMHRLLTVTKLRPVAEYGREIVPSESLLGQDKRSNWRRRALDYATLPESYERGYKALSGKPGFRDNLIRLGRTRTLIYKVLVTTGLRKGELASIRLCQLCLDSEDPKLILEAKDEKNGEGSTICLRADIVVELQEYLAAYSPWLRPEEPILEVPKGLCRIFNRDLAAAGIPKRDGRGRVVDVHALRHTFCTNLNNAGVPLRIAQAAMRHSTPLLTATIYTDPILLDVAGAINKLPELSSPTTEEPRSNEKQVSA